MSHRDTIPDFLVEQLDTLDEAALLAVADYAESNGVPPDEVPEDISTAFALQDDETLAAVAAYARDLAAAEEERDGSQEAADRDTEAPTDADDDEDDGNPDQASGMFSHGW